jgi:hypothetical protein
MNDIKHQLLAKIDKQSLRDNLKENIQIHSIKGNVVHIITISSMTNMLLQKKETIQYLEKILEEILERPISLSSEFIKKEDYLQSMI